MVVLSYGSQDKQGFKVQDEANQPITPHQASLPARVHHNNRKHAAYAAVIL
jgi:hypothetical protein